MEYELCCFCDVLNFFDREIGWDSPGACRAPGDKSVCVTQAAGLVDALADPRHWAHLPGKSHLTERDHLGMHRFVGFGRNN